ncbi:MAG: hypothetical protein ACHQ2E_06485 [Gemmatimonadales bacterium]
MDPGVIALMIPIVAIVCGTLLKFASMRSAERRDAGGGDTIARLEAMEQELTAVRQELAEAHERLDFTERLLAKGQEGKRVGEDAR